MIGSINRQTIIYKCIACYGVVAGTGEADAVIVVADSIAGYGVVAGRGEVDAVIVVVADIVACYDVVVCGYFDPRIVKQPSGVCHIESFNCNTLSG